VLPQIPVESDFFTRNVKTKYFKMNHSGISYLHCFLAFERFHFLLSKFRLTFLTKPLFYEVHPQVYSLDIDSFVLIFDSKRASFPFFPFLLCFSFPSALLWAPLFLCCLSVFFSFSFFVLSSSYSYLRFYFFRFADSFFLFSLSFFFFFFFFF